MRKIILLLALSFILVAHQSARAADTVTALDGVMGIGDTSSKNTVEVNDAGAMLTSHATRTIKSQTGSGQVYTGTCRVFTVNMYSDGTGDMIHVFNSILQHPVVNNSLLLLEFEIGIAANTCSNSYDAKGATFSNGIFVTASDNTNTRVTVVYDY